MNCQEMLNYINKWYDKGVGPNEREKLIIPPDILDEIIELSKNYKNTNNYEWHPLEKILIRSIRYKVYPNLTRLKDKLSIEKFFKTLKKISDSDMLIVHIEDFITKNTFDIDDTLYMIRNLPQRKNWKISVLARLLDMLAENYPEDLDKILNCISTIVVEFMMKKSDIFKKYLSQGDFETKFDLNISVKDIDTVKLLLSLKK